MSGGRGQHIAAWLVVVAQNSHVGERTQHELLQQLIRIPPDELVHSVCGKLGQKAPEEFG
jgi:hypothetical protein